MTKEQENKQRYFEKMIARAHRRFPFCVNAVKAVVLPTSLPEQADNHFKEMVYWSEMSKHWKKVMGDAPVPKANYKSWERKENAGAICVFNFDTLFSEN